MNTSQVNFVRSAAKTLEFGLIYKHTAHMYLLVFFVFSVSFFYFQFTLRDLRFKFFFGSPTKTTTNRNKVIYLVFPLLLYNCLSKIDMHNKKIITIQYACPRQIKYTYTQTLFFRGLEAHSVTISL